MSGCKRRSHYRKHVSQSALGDAPELEEGDDVVRVIGSRGGNIFEVESGDGSRSLARLPTKFHKLVWVKRGSFLVVSSSSADYLTSKGEAGKVVFNVKAVLLEEQVAALKEDPIWPDAFREDGDSAPSTASEITARRSRTIESAAMGGDGGGGGGAASAASRAGGAGGAGSDAEQQQDEDEKEEEDDDMPGIFRNTNHVARGGAESSDDESSEEAWLARTAAR